MRELRLSDIICLCSPYRYGAPVQGNDSSIVKYLQERKAQSSSGPFDSKKAFHLPYLELKNRYLNFVKPWILGSLGRSV